MKDRQKLMIWYDRKRWLGMKLTFTCYSVDKNRLYIKRGFLNTVYDEVLLYHVLDLRLTRTLGQRIEGTGTIILYTADISDGTVKIENIKNPMHIFSMLSKLVENARKANGIIGREINGIAGSPDFNGDGTPG